MFVRRVINGLFSRVSLPWFGTVVIGDVTIKIQLKGAIEWKLRFPWLAGGWESDELLRWVKLCRKFPTGAVLDVGANTGVYSLLAASVDRSRPIYAFEPIPNFAATLINNARVNGFGNIAVSCAAVSHEDGLVELTFPRRTGVFYSFSLQRDFYPNELKQKCLVPTVALDTIASLQRAVALIKVDVEGHEKAVFQGMVQLLKNSRPIVMFEIIKGEERSSKEMLCSYLPQGYELFVNGVTCRVDDIDNLVATEPYVNVYAVPAEKSAAFFSL